MKKIVTALLLSAVPVLGLAAPAEADSSDLGNFLAVLHSHGWYAERGGDYTLVRGGYAACGLLERGVSASSVAREFYLNTGLDVSRADAAQFVVTAVHYLCPRFEYPSVA